MSEGTLLKSKVPPLGENEPISAIAPLSKETKVYFTFVGFDKNLLFVISSISLSAGDTVTCFDSLISEMR